MECVRNVIAPIGMDRLFREMVASALSIHGWRLLDVERENLRPDEPVEIALVASSVKAESVIQRVRQAHAEFPGAKVVLLGDESPNADLVRFIGEGARAYVPCSQGIADLVETLEMVRGNRTRCSGGVTQLVIHSIRRLSREHDGAGEAPLTSREQEVLRLITSGLSNKEIAGRLSIAPNTVKNHVHHLLEKLKVRSRHEAASAKIRVPGR